VLTLALLAALGFFAFWQLTAPHPLREADLPQHQADIRNGERLFHAGGCLSCHKPGPELKAVDRSLPAGGAPLKTPLGIFYPPNLTPDEATGIGKWTATDFANAVQRGLAPDGSHLIPAFPYASYARMKTEDVLDIRAYLMSLKPVTSPPKPADIPVAWFLRRGIGLWKLLGLDTQPWQPDPMQTAAWNRGSYLVNGPGHCGECHTPRTIFMVMDQSRFMAGGPHPGGDGKVPSLVSLIGRKKFKDVADLASGLAYGETMGYDHMAAGGMGEVQTNMSKLPPEDVAAIAAYLASLK
jgi:mono/diheme cytochrome c family protein